MGGFGGAKKGEKKAPHLIGAATSGVLEIAIFHPVDTIGKRLMTNKLPIFTPERSFMQSMRTAHGIVLRDAASKGLVGQFFSLYPGVGFGAVYKILQRTYKFAGQPIMRNAMRAKYGEQMTKKFGSKTATDLLNSVSGSLIGLGEVVLLPFDTLKIKAQTNPDALKGKGLYEIFVKDGASLYRGWNWTACRNIPGSFLLFGVNSFIYTRVFGTTGPKDSPLHAIFLASACGAVASIVATNPLDVIKTRVQSRHVDDPRSGMSLVKDLLKDEGPTAFFKGVTPKTLLIGPKLIFSFFVAQAITSRIQRAWEEKDSTKAQATN